MPQQTELPFVQADTRGAGETARTIALADRIVAYTLRRARRRTIGLTIDQRGLRVGAPNRTPLTEVETLIRKHADWVVNKLDEWRLRRHAEPPQLTDGCRLPYLGGSLEIRIVSGHNRFTWDERTLPAAPPAPPVLRLAPRAPEETPALLVRALRQRALSLFTERLAGQAARFGIAPPPLALSSARTRWGSCSTRSGIRLNWRLIHCDWPLIDYVIVHELAHLWEMNHSPRFWSIVGRHYPDYRSARAALKKLSGELPVLP